MPPDAVARQIEASRAPTTAGQLAADWARPDPESSLRDPPTPLRGYQILELTVEDGSPAIGRGLGTLTWPSDWMPVSVLHDRRLRAPDPGIVLSPGDRINLLASRGPASSGASQA